MIQKNNTPDADQRQTTGSECTKRTGTHARTIAKCWVLYFLFFFCVWPPTHQASDDDRLSVGVQDDVLAGVTAQEDAAAALRRRSARERFHESWSHLLRGDLFIYGDDDRCVLRRVTSVYVRCRLDLSVPPWSGVHSSSSFKFVQIRI